MPDFLYTDGLIANAALLPIFNEQQISDIVQTITQRRRLGIQLDEIGSCASVRSIPQDKETGQDELKLVNFSCVNIISAGRAKNVHWTHSKSTYLISVDESIVETSQSIQTAAEYEAVVNPFRSDFIHQTGLA